MRIFVLIAGALLSTSTFANLVSVTASGTIVSVSQTSGPDNPFPVIQVGDPFSVEYIFDIDSIPEPDSSPTGSNPEQYFTDQVQYDVSVTVNGVAATYTDSCRCVLETLNALTTAGIDRASYLFTDSRGPLN